MYNRRRKCHVSLPQKMAFKIIINYYLYVIELNNKLLIVFILNCKFYFKF